MSKDYQEIRAERKARKAARNAKLKKHGYKWVEVQQDWQGWGFDETTDRARTEWELRAPDGRAVTVGQALEEIEKGIEQVQKEKERKARAKQEQKQQEAEEAEAKARKFEALKAEITEASSGVEVEPRLLPDSAVKVMKHKVSSSATEIIHETDDAYYIERIARWISGYVGEHIITKYNKSQEETVPMNTKARYLKAYSLTRELFQDLYQNVENYARDDERRAEIEAWLEQHPRVAQLAEDHFRSRNDTDGLVHQIPGYYHFRSRNDTDGLEYTRKMLERPELSRQTNLRFTPEQRARRFDHSPNYADYIEDE